MLFSILHEPKCPFPWLGSWVPRSCQSARWSWSCWPMLGVLSSPWGWFPLGTAQEEPEQDILSLSEALAFLPLPCCPWAPSVGRAEPSITNLSNPELNKSFSSSTPLCNHESRQVIIICSLGASTSKHYIISYRKFSFKWKRCSGDIL